MRIPLLLALGLVAAAPAGAATLARLEQEVVRLAAERDATRAERAQLSAEAVPLVEAIARSREPGASAGRELTRRLRDLDRVASRLDELDRRLRDVERRMEQALSMVSEESEREERALLERARRLGIASVAADLTSIADIRRRVAAVAAAPRFRPPLEVSVGPVDGPGEIEAKLKVIDGERARIASRQQELVREESLLAARLRGRREWARDLGAARRDAGGEVELLERAHESAEAALRELGVQAEAVSSEQARLRQWDEGLLARRREAEERLRSLQTRRGAP